MLLSLGFAAGVSCHTHTIRQKVQANAIEQNILAASERMVDGISQMQRSSASFLVNPDGDFLGIYEKGAQLLEESSDYLDRHLEKPQQRDRFEKIRHLTAEIDMLNRYSIDLTQQKKRDQAIRAFGAAESIRLSAELAEVVEDFITVQNQLQMTTAEEIKGAILALNHWLWVGSAALGMVALAIGIWLAQRIADTLNDRVAALKGLAKEIVHGVLAGDRATSSQARALNQTSRLLQDLSQSGDLHTLQVQSTMVEVERIAARINALADQIAQIYELADRVSDLADLTHLFALNAGVEATRSGWHCHCFDAIATKMRTLATDTQKSAIQVNALVADLEKDSYSDGVEMSPTSSAIENLQLAIAGIGDKIGQLSLESQYSNTTLQQAIEGLDEPYKSSLEAINGISETKISLKELNIAANRLQELL